MRLETGCKHFSKKTARNVSFYDIIEGESGYICGFNYNLKRVMIMLINTNMNNGFSSFPIGNMASSPHAIAKNELLQHLMAQHTSSNSADLSTNLRSYLVNIRGAASGMQSAVGALTATGANSLYTQRTVSSSNENIMSMSVANGTTISDSLRESRFTVENIATSQMNAGRSINAGSQFNNWSGSELNITDVDGTEHTFSVSSSARTAREAQTDLARSINDSNIGVRASVEFDQKTNTSRLVLVGRETGEENSFSVSGGLSQTFGVAESTRDAGDAVYTVNGERRASSSNTIELEDGVSATLRAPSAETELSISERQDRTGLQNAMNSMVKSFNEMMKAAQDNSERDSGAARLLNSLNGIARTYSSGLARIGISINGDGHMEIDAKKLGEAMESGELERFIAPSNRGSNFGFANRLESLASKVNSDATSFLSNDARITVNGENATFTHEFSRNSSRTSHFVNRMNHLHTMGMLFDMMS